jgi:hypothetical protein
MIDQETAGEGVALLSTAIAELMEDAHEIAVVVHPMPRSDLASRALGLKAVAADLGILADAMEVLRRRSDHATLGLS